ncbi:putative pyridoxal kinase [Paecilomyces lecythidis]
MSNGEEAKGTAAAHPDFDETKIALIEDRLSRIEGLLQDLAANSNVATLPTRIRADVNPSCTVQETPLPSVAQPPSEPDMTTANKTFEGESSFRAHFVHASKLFERAMSVDNLVGRSPEMQEAISNLRSLVEKQNTLSVNHDLRFPGQKAAPALDFSSVKMPPMASVVSLLRLCKETMSSNFLELPFLDYMKFDDMCKKVYFATEDYSMALFTLVNGGLYYLFSEVCMLRGQNSAEFKECAAICRSNFEYTIGKFDVLTAPTLENIQALCLGAFYSIDISRPSLCWALASNAARLCQILGYHRSVATPGDTRSDIELKKKMFWFVYVLDKSLSLRLGRSSTLQDYDITLERPGESSDVGLRAWDTVYNFWIDLARFNGRVYEQLYSARALSDSEADRVQRAKDIIRDMQCWYQGILDTDHKAVYSPYYFEATTSACAIVYYSVLTLVYRTIPPDPSDHSAIFSNDCIETARATLRAHYQNSSRYKESNNYIWNGYISWTLMHCPFTPFLVVFCQAIAVADLSDLKLLGEFVSSLQPVSEVSEATEKLYRLCQVFHRVAELYIDAKIKRNSNMHIHQDASVSGTNTMYPVNDFDPYLSALGFTSAGGMSSFPNSGISAGEMPPSEYDGMAASGSLGDWFAGNLNIMALLEADLSNINTINM